MAIHIVPDEPKAQVMLPKAQGYIGNFLSEELSPGRNALDDLKYSKIFMHINLENFVVLTRSLYLKKELRYRQSSIFRVL